MLAKVLSSAVLGVDAYMVEVEVDIALGLPSFSTVGLPDLAVKESRDRVKAAIKNCGFDFPPRRITVNLAPADIKKEGAGFDLPMAIGVLAAQGMQEIISYPTTTPEAQEKVRASGGPAPMKLQNPISSDQAYLRTTLRVSILQAVARNSHTWRESIALYEMGAEYLYHGEGLPHERQSVVGALAGDRPASGGWDTAVETADFFDAKGIVEGMLADLGIQADFSPHDDATFTPGRCAEIKVSGARVGVIGEVAVDILEDIDCDRSPVPMFEIDIEALEKASGDLFAPVAYQSFDRYPESVRDLAIVIDESVEAGEVMEIISKNRLATTASIVDVYRGDGVPEGRKSLAVRVHYQSDKKTLTADEIGKAEQSILKVLGRELNAELRA